MFVFREAAGQLLAQQRHLYLDQQLLARDFAMFLAWGKPVHWNI